MTEKRDANDTLREDGPAAVRERKERAVRYVNGASVDLDVVRCSDVEVKKISWLWPNRFARGKLSLIVGHPGLGKSQLGLDMAARISRGAPWPSAPDTAPVGSVLVLSAEDDASDTIVPRLAAAGADLKKIYIIQSVKDGDKRRGFDITKDLVGLEKLMKKLGDVAMVLIDPITAYMGMKLDSHKNTDVRAALQPLAEVGQEYGVAIIGITHMPKTSSGAAVLRTIGSIAFGAAARAIFYVIETKLEPDGEPSERRLFLPGKNNLGVDRGTGLAYQIETRGDACAISWFEAAVTTTVEEAMGEKAPRRAPKTEDAIRFLHDHLEKGPRAAREVEAAAASARIAPKTLRDARERVGIVLSRDRDGRSMWALPSLDELPF